MLLLAKNRLKKIYVLTLIKESPVLSTEVKQIKLTNQTATVLKFILTTRFLRVILQKGRSMAGDVVSLVEVKFTRVLFAMILCMAKGFSNGRMEEYSMGCFRRARKTARECTTGPQAKFTKVILKMISVLVKVLFTIQMARLL